MRRNLLGLRRTGMAVAAVSVIVAIVMVLASSGRFRPPCGPVRAGARCGHDRAAVLGVDREPRLGPRTGRGLQGTV